MSDNKTAYLITIGEPEIDGIMADTFEEALILSDSQSDQIRSYSSEWTTS